MNLDFSQVFGALHVPLNYLLWCTSKHCTSNGWVAYNGLWYRSQVLHLNLSQCFESLYVPLHHHLLLRYTSNSVREMGELLPTIIDCGTLQVLHPNLSQCSGALYASLHHHHHHHRLRCTSKQTLCVKSMGCLE